MNEKTINRIEIKNPARIMIMEVGKKLRCRDRKLHLKIIIINLEFYDIKN